VAVVPLPCAREILPHTVAFRSTWVVSSHEGLRAIGKWEKYLACLHDHREPILACVAGAWLPIAVARSHYEACDAVGISVDEIDVMARGAGGQVRKAWHATFFATADRSGASPWGVLSQIDRLWRRSADGGAVAVFGLGERMARVEYVGCELFEIPYFRHAVRTSLTILLEHVAKHVTVTFIGQPGHAEAHYRAQWT
jgi:hypothetical protein